ncbi:hypothetical protein [Pseudofrankia sp. DC12]|uniref:hypothetical protein n=1 Tax=Pseudofrankia sp. DC12 TaxID=683315 RepID=UPI0005F83F87|nr:hypothetical protein [Pseudofrankia sp. DC12]
MTSPPDDEATPGDNPPTSAKGQTSIEAGRSIVVVEVPAGSWRLYPTAEPDGSGRGFVAELTATREGDQTGPRQVLWWARRATLWRLEEACGWPIPLRVQRLLLTLPAHPNPRDPRLDRYGPDTTPTGRPTAQSPGRQDATSAPPPTPQLGDDVISAPPGRPWRASRVRVDDGPGISYGRLRADDRPAHQWCHGDLHAEILDLPPNVTTIGALTLWRIRDRDGVVYAGPDILGRTEGALSGDELIRAVLHTPAILHRAAATRTRRQHDFLTRHRDTLIAAATFAEHPYPPGTRVRLTAAPAVAGTVLGSRTGTDGRRRYLWRPDTADLPGHPWQHHPTWTLETPRLHLIPTLTTTASDGQHGPSPILATGAVIATIEDPRFATGTVLRAHANHRGELTYEIQPHDAPLHPVMLAADAVVPLRPSAWPSVADLLDARRAAALPLRSGELLTSTHDQATTTDSGAPHPNIPPAQANTTPDPTRGAHPVDIQALGLNPKAAARPPAVRTAPPATGNPDRPGPEPAHGDLPSPARPVDKPPATVAVHDPVYGHLAVRAADYEAALRLGADRLTELLTRRRWLPSRQQPLEITAVLAVIHAPGDVLGSHLHDPSPPAPSSESPAAAPTPPSWDGP